MQLTRRDVHKGVAGLLLSALAGGRALAAASAARRPEDVFLNRLSFGATPQSRARLAALGREAWLEEQLAMPVNGPEIRARLAKARLWIEYEAGETTPEDPDTPPRPWPAMAEHRPLKWLFARPEELVQLLREDLPLAGEERERPAYEARLASLVRAVHDPAQLNEVMTQFWLNHFSVNANKDDLTHALFPVYDQGMRAHALGNFRDLLAVSAKAPVMLRYLDNDESRASPANENYARELLELHTLGQEHYFNDRYEHWSEVPGAREGLAAGYIDDDVYEVARALTGWSIGDGREFEENEFAPWSGEMYYIEAWHDPYQKRILGVEFEDHAPPLQDGERLLDLLAAHPGTARFVTGKLLRRLGIEAPSEAYRAAAAEAFLANRDRPDQIAQVIRTIVRHPEFDATPPGKLRRPFGFLAAVLRATGAELEPTSDDIFWLLDQAGWHHYEVRPPTGASDHSADWANTRTINGLLNLALEAHAEGAALTDDILRRAPEGVRDMAGLAAHWAGRFGTDPARMAPILTALELAPDDPLPPPDDVDVLEWTNRMMVATAALDPVFLYR